MPSRSYLKESDTTKTIERSIQEIPFWCYMTYLRNTKDGVILLVKVIPNASKDEIVGWKEGHLRIKVCAPPEKGKANQAVINLLSKTYNLPQSKIILLKGAAGRQKEFLLAGYTKLDFEQKLTG